MDGISICELGRKASSKSDACLSPSRSHFTPSLESKLGGFTFAKLFTEPVYSPSYLTYALVTAIVQHHKDVRSLDLTDMPPEILKTEGPALCFSERRGPIAAPVGSDDTRE